MPPELTTFDAQWERVSISLVHAGRYPCKPDWHLPARVSRGHTIWFIEKGESWVERDGIRIEARPGDVFLFREGHTYENGHNPKRCLTVLSTSFSIMGPGQIDLLRGYKIPDRTAVPKAQQKELVSRFNALIADQKDIHQFRRLAGQGALLRLLAECLRLFECLPARNKFGGTNPSPGALSRMEEVKNFVDIHLAEKLSIERLAKSAHLSASHFAALFRKQTGAAPMEYVRQRRLEKAKTMLVSSDQSIAQIAASVSFADQFHFSRLFKRAVGVTPSAYRTSFENPFLS